MKKPIQVLNGAGQLVSGAICTMTEDHLIELQTIWEAMLSATEQPDEGWGWAYKLRQSQRQERFEAYAIEVNDLAQGLIFIETQWHRSHINRQNRLVYIEAMTTAPWNRKQIEDPPFYRNIGSNLIAFSRRRSVDLGYQGRLGLHALPEAEGFYRRIQMPEYEADEEKEGLVYFEYGTV